MTENRINFKKESSMREVSREYQKDKVLKHTSYKLMKNADKDSLKEANLIKRSVFKDLDTSFELKQCQDFKLEENQTPKRDHYVKIKQRPSSIYDCVLQQNKIL
jgi:hypothetical protein